MQIRQVGVVGLGNMGLPMAKVLRKAGFAVSGFDLSGPRLALAEENGILPAADLVALLNQVDAVVASLPYARDVEAVLTMDGGLLQRRDRRVVVVDTSTADATTSRRLAELLGTAGHGHLDAPVSGGPSGAADGTLTMMVGGSEQDYADARPVIEALTGKAIHVGPSGAGNVAKLINNMLVAAHMVTTGEAIRLAEAAGVPAEAVLQVVNAATGRSGVSEVHFPRWIMSNRFDSGFTTGLMRKDVGLAAELAEEVGIDLPLSREVARVWLENRAEVSDAEDFTRMSGYQPKAAPAREPGREALRASRLGTARGGPAPAPEGGSPDGGEPEPEAPIAASATHERQGRPSVSDDPVQTGLTIRGDVIGKERSDGAWQSATAFDRPFQELALKYCWGEIWGRPGLDRRTRSIVNLAMLSAMAKPNELRIHTRGALTNGVTKREIQEIFLQAMVYCGVPTAGEAFKVAREVFEEPDYAKLGGEPI